MTRSFLWAYLAELVASLPNRYGDDNHDTLRFDTPQRRGRLARFGLDIAQARHFLRTTKFVLTARAQLEWLYRQLADESSRALLAKVLSYRALGYRKVKLPLNTPAYRQASAAIEQLADPNDALQLDHDPRPLHRYHLRDLAIPLELYLHPSGLNAIFNVAQYRYAPELAAGDAPLIAALSGDYVLDVGACWGDTALYFAWQVGPTGRVYSWEFVPSNLHILRKNLAINPDFAPRIELVEAPAWSTSGHMLYFSDKGAGSRVRFTPFPGMVGQVQTLTLDDLVQQRNLPRVDFIKMDIEGAEMHALRGAEATLRRFRPKLAISVYHSLRDFVDVPAYLDSLGLGYRFYLKHATIHRWETVLFADPQPV